MIRHCVVCGVEIKTTDMRVTRCPPHRVLFKRGAWNRQPLYCKVCNKPIPIGSGRAYYCSDECNKSALHARDRKRDLLRRSKQMSAKVDAMTKELSGR